ncbi:hypothetical protein BH09ACT7_BH09ACT7_08250 [soil metagenome]
MGVNFEINLDGMKKLVHMGVTPNSAEAARMVRDARKG